MLKKDQKFGSTQRINHDSSDFYKSNLFHNKVNLSSNSPEYRFPENIRNQILFGDSQKMSEIPDNSVHLMITSPPYNVSKEYDQNLFLDEYLELLRNVFSETYRVLVHGGRVCVNIANLGRKPYLPISDYIQTIMNEIGFLMRGEIIWNKGSGSGVSMAWGSFQSPSNPVLRDVHEYILVFSKGDFKRENHQKTSTISKEQFMEWTKSIWTFNPEQARRINHPAPFPIELPYRLIQLFSYQDDIVLDPFVGSGTTAIAALKTKRSYIGYDLNEKYIKIAKRRIMFETMQVEMDFRIDSGNKDTFG